MLEPKNLDFKLITHLEYRDSKEDTHNHIFIKKKPKIVALKHCFKKTEYGRNNHFIIVLKQCWNLDRRDSKEHAQGERDKEKEKET